MADLKLVNVKKVYPWESASEKKKALANPGNLEYTDEGVVAVSDFNLTIADKEFIVLVGPSGCGKSTTLRMIAGLEDISSGEIYIGDKLVNDVAPKDRDIAMVFQNYALFPHMTVYENMAFSLKMRHTPKDIIDKKVREAAEILGITEYLDRKPKALSGGQRQRVAIGRAIVREPKVFLMDEPLSNLDAKLRNQMRAEIIKLRRKVDTTFVYVTHDQTEAMTMADRIVVMKDGYVQQIGTPKDVYFNPRNMFVAGFIGEPPMNFLRRVVEKGCIKVGEASFDLSKRLGERAADYEGKEIVFGFRPEAIVLGAQENAYTTAGMVELTEMLGDNANVYLDIDENKAILKVSPHEIPANDTKVTFSIPYESVYLFDAETEVVIK